MSKSIENLMWVQEYLDYYVELGGTIPELHVKIQAQINMIGTHITGNKSLYDINNNWMPKLVRFYKALEELQKFVEAAGPQEAGVVDKDWLIVQWGMFLDYYTGDYDQVKRDHITPFLVHMQRHYENTVAADTIIAFISYVMGDEYVELILIEYNDRMLG